MPVCLKADQPSRRGAEARGTLLEPCAGDLAIGHLMDGDHVHLPASFGEMSCDDFAVDDQIIHGLLRSLFRMRPFS